MMNTRITLWRIKEIAYLSATQKASVNHDSYELKWAVERDADEYRKKVAKERRDNPDALIAKDRKFWPMQKSF